MSGCFDGAVGDAEADGGDDETSELDQFKEVITMFVEADNPQTVTVNGTTLVLMEHWVGSQTNGWDQHGWVKYDITCKDGFRFTDYVTISHNYDDVILPTSPDYECDIEISGEGGDRIVSFREIQVKSWS